MSKGNANLSGDAPESLAAINTAMPENHKINSVEIGKYYGNAADQTLRVVYNPAEIHPWQHFSVASTGYLADFFTKAFQINNPLSSGIMVIAQLTENPLLCHRKFTGIIPHI